VAVFANFPVSLGIEVRGDDQDAELAVAESRDEAACLSYADAVGRRVALGLQSELDCDRVRMETEQVLSDGISPAVAPWTGDVDLVHVGLARSHRSAANCSKSCGRSLKC
jgi:hypothetical protein